jgi:predicted MFS family arabinose efflux permease
MGIYTIGVVLAPALGPTLAGFLVDEYSWRYVFLAIVPVCVAAMAATAVFLPGRDTRQGAISQRFDGFGCLFLVAFLVCLLSALSNGQREGWNSDLILALFAAAMASAVAFVEWELKCRMPLLNLRVFASGGFTASCLVAFVLGAGIYGSTYIVPLFVQLVQGYTPTRSGLLLMPAGFGLAMVSPLAGHLGDRLPPWAPIMAGMAYLETLMAPKARLFAYRDGFLVVAVMFFAALLPALLMRRRRPESDGAADGHFDRRMEGVARHTWRIRRIWDQSSPGAQI